MISILLLNAVFRPQFFNFPIKFKDNTFKIPNPNRYIVTYALSVCIEVLCTEAKYQSIKISNDIQKETQNSSIAED